MSTNTSAPHSPWTIRAVQLDLARQMETVDFICDYAEKAAGWGFNTLVLYLEARVQTPSFPYRPREESYTLEEMARVVEHARKVGVEVVPALATLGHCEQFFACPEMAHMAEERDGHTRFGGTGCSTFCPSLPETYAFFAQYIHELAQVFTAPHIHVGCDEAWNLGYCHLCSERWGSDGLGAIFTQHLQRMHAICREAGKRMWIWDDFYELFPAELEQAPRDMVMCHWNYDQVIWPEGGQAHFVNRWRQDWLAEYARLGIDALICPWSGVRNIETFTDYARRWPVLGGLLTQWEMTATFHEQVATAVAYGGKLWSRVDGDSEQAWREALPAVLPQASPLVQQTIRHMTEIGFVGPRATPQTYLSGPLTEGEALHRAAMRNSEALLRLACAAQPAAVDTEIPDEYLALARLSLLHYDLRELLPAIYDPRRHEQDVPRLTAKAQACRQELDALIALRAPLHDRRRPGMFPQHGASHYLQAVRDGLAPAWERLARAPQPSDWQLLLRLFLPDTHGAPRLRVSARFGADTRELLFGGYKPADTQPGSHYSLQLPFTADTAPDAICLEGWGYGGQGIAFLELHNPTTTLLPTSIITTAGPVSNPAAILRDDSFWAYLGTTDILAAIHTPALADERGVIEVALAVK